MFAAWCLGNQSVNQKKNALPKAKAYFKVAPDTL